MVYLKLIWVFLWVVAQTKGSPVTSSPVSNIDESNAGLTSSQEPVFSDRIRNKRSPFLGFLGLTSLISNRDSHNTHATASAGGGRDSHSNSNGYSLNAGIYRVSASSASSYSGGGNRKTYATASSGAGRNGNQASTSMGAEGGDASYAHTNAMSIGFGPFSKSCSETTALSSNSGRVTQKKCKVGFGSLTWDV